MSSLYESFPELSGNEVFVKGARMNDTQNTARRKSCSYLCPEEGVMLHVGIDTDNNKTAVSVYRTLRTCFGKHWKCLVIKLVLFNVH